MKTYTSSPEVVRNNKGDVIRSSRNLRGIREHVAAGMKHYPFNLVKVLSVDSIGQREGKLCILFDNGDNFETNFASYSVLCGWILNWRNVHGAPLVMNGQDVGKVHKAHGKLLEGARR